MKKQPFCNFYLAGLSITDYGLLIPSPFCSLSITNSQISSMTSWTLKCVIGGDANKHANASAFEALLYGAAQSASNYSNSSGIPVSFIFGWLSDDGSVSDNVSYQGFTLQFKVSTSGQYMIYEVSGYASLALQSSIPVLRIPAVCGVVQPSAVVEGLAKAVKATNYYQLDIDHDDAPTLVEHGVLTTSFNKYVRGSYSAEDDYNSFPGLLRLSKSYNSSREAGGVKSGYGKLNNIMNNLKISPLSNFLKKSLTDNTPQCSSYSYWVDEPTMTSPGVIHYKSNSGLLSSHFSDVLEYGTANTNVLSLNGSYNGVAYNMTNMNFSYLGFALDGSGNTIAQDAQVINSWSSSLANVYQSANIINDVNALASQFSGDFTITIPGSCKKYEVAQPVSLLVMSGNTLSPITGVYNVISVSHDISDTFITTIKIQRLTMSSANQTAVSQGIVYQKNSNLSGYRKTDNVISSGKVDFGYLYPNYEHMTIE